MSDGFVQALQALSAPAFLSVFILLLMLQIAFYRNATLSWFLSCVALLISIPLCIYFGQKESALQVTPLLVADRFSLLFSVLILFATLVTTLLAKRYLAHRAGENEEFYLLILLSALGGLFLVSATHLASFLLGLELLGVALYALIAYPERGHYPLEAAIKYLILSAAASAILLFGFALLYAALGTLDFNAIGVALQSSGAQANQQLILTASVFIVAGLSFKLSLVPFHMWTPDVYQGAPSPVTGFLATVSKTAIFAAMLRFFIAAELYQFHSLILALTLIAVASMLAGNLLALLQDNLKRLLAYSSIAHFGYLLIAVLILSVMHTQNMAVEAASYYLIAYVVTSLAAFSLLTVMAAHTPESSTGDTSALQGLFWQHPMLATMFTVALLSLAGIPLTAGFIGKFYLFNLGIQAALWWAVAGLLLGSAIGIYYYLKLVFAMAQQPQPENSGIVMGNESRLTLIILAILLIALILYFGVLPQSFMSWIGAIEL